MNNHTYFAAKLVETRVLIYTQTGPKDAETHEITYETVAFLEKSDAWHLLTELVEALTEGRFLKESEIDDLRGYADFAEECIKDPKLLWRHSEVMPAID